MGFTIFQAAELPFVPRDETDPRSVARLSDALAESRANVWRYPPGAQGKRHRDLGQEEVFVVLDGTLTVDLVVLRDRVALLDLDDVQPERGDAEPAADERPAAAALEVVQTADREVGHGGTG